MDPLRALISVQVSRLRCNTVTCLVNEPLPLVRKTGWCLRESGDEEIGFADADSGNGAHAFRISLSRPMSESPETVSVPVDVEQDND